MKRVVSLEIIRMSPDQRAELKRLAEACREVINCIWQTWLIYHVNVGTPQIIREYFDDVAAWRELGEKGDRPKLGISAVEAECSKAIYKAVTETFHDVHSRPLALLMNTVIGKIKHLKSANGQLPGWMSILLYRQSIPSTTRLIPIPFDRRNAEIIPPPPGEAQDWKIRVRLDRFERETQSGTRVFTSTTEELTLLSRGHRVAGQVALLKRIATGEYKLCGSNIVYDASNRKWFVHVCYERPDEKVPGLDSERVAFLRPALFNSLNREGKPWAHPWNLRIGRRRRAPGGTGACVAAVRRKLFIERVSRQNGYRVATHANKGHGRNRALQPIWRLENRWKDFVKTFNYSVARDVVNQCIATGTGRLVYFQPGGKVKETRFLSQAGKQDHFHESSSWDYYQIGARLQVLCADAGIEFVWRKSRDLPSAQADAVRKRTKPKSKNACCEKNKAKAAASR